MKQAVILTHSLNDISYKIKKFIQPCITEKYYPITHQQLNSQIAKFMGPTWGPPGSCRPQVGPKLAPWTLLSGLLSLSDAIWWHRTWLTLVQVMAHCLTAPSYCLNQCSLISSEVSMYSLKISLEMLKISIYTFKITTISLLGQWIKMPWLL